MDIQQFITHMEDVIDDLEPGLLTPDTHFRDLEVWSSINALLTLAMIFSEYQVQINASDLHNSQTIDELFQVVSQRVQAAALAS